MAIYKPPGETACRPGGSRSIWRSGIRAIIFGMERVFLLPSFLPYSTLPNAAATNAFVNHECGRDCKTYHFSVSGNVTKGRQGTHCSEIASLALAITAILEDST